MKSKILSVFCFVLIVFIFLGSNVFAYTSETGHSIDDEVFNKIIEFGKSQSVYFDGEHYMILYDHGGNKNYRLYFFPKISDEHYVTATTGDDRMRMCVNGNRCATFGPVYMYRFDANGNYLPDSSNLNYTCNDGEYVKRQYLLYSNVDIYGDLGGSTVFFSAQNLGTLAQVLEKVEMGTVLLEIVKIIPLILVVVVSFLGLRKALQMLSILLRRS